MDDHAGNGRHRRPVDYDNPAGPGCTCCDPMWSSCRQAPPPPPARHRRPHEDDPVPDGVVSLREWRIKHMARGFDG
ncbi:hypothetical protein [Streptomyces sp. NBC_00989]|uniref:hypothetical protein n=1 Tax=Streptomyces sp. NBC_00989 TaxID=2903705 RepID=UPI00386591AD|nr:hypothetical protein OG714_38335 [Streptomyces sp. NBC_00989]